MTAFLRPGVVVVDNLLTQADLDILCSVVADVQFEEQQYGRRVLAQRERATSTDSIVPSLLWNRLEPVLPPIGEFLNGSPAAPRLDPPIDQWRAFGCNPLTRFYRYAIGASFSEHEDEPWKPDPMTRSLLTVLAYLPAGGCVGGETVIDGEIVQAIDGRVVVFDHGLLHEGRPVERGHKLVLRSDVIARPGHSGTSDGQS